jgi:hypothetical protein
VTATYTVPPTRGDGAVRDFGIVEVVERQFLRTLRQFPLPPSVDDQECPHRHTPRWPRRETRAPAMREAEYGRRYFRTIF